ncbi:hypothetical protein QEO94_11235 [Kingella negevensis]|uniref:hypothetical protein n=1 Tax=Kingella negevensis TaxID=1522312 RepID=UPI00254358E5|nr:hypothetical protein [Kingella negevensis]WII93172.1 hypothetical protein QEO94_11235 [Kingella negevensis]
MNQQNSERKQIRFVNYVALILQQHHIVYFLDLNDEWDAIFHLCHFSGSLKAMFPYFWVEQDGDKWVMCNPNTPYIQAVFTGANT